jgi:hypothetical protein
MNRILLIVLGLAAAAGLAILLLMSPAEPERQAFVETPAATDVEPAQPDATLVAGDVEEPGEEGDTASEPSVEEEPTVVSLYSVDGRISPGEYAHSTSVVDVQVHWANSEGALRVGLVSPGTGYVAIGFDPERGMEGANFIIGNVQDGKAAVRDDYGISETGHIADTDRGGENNVLSSAGSEWPDQTIIEFVIPLDSGDPTDKPLIPGNTYPILVAYHGTNDAFSVRHTRRGSGEIQLDPVP